MSLLGPDRLLVGRSVVDRKEARCIHCMQPIKFGPKGEPGVVHSREGMKEMGISGMCETCFDNLSGEPDDWTFLEFKRSADEDEPCPCAGGTATCRGNCPIFDKVAKQDAAQPSQAPVVQAVQATQAVRMLTPREIELLREIRLHAQFGLNEGWQREARNLLLELEQYYRTIPPSGEIGGA